MTQSLYDYCLEHGGALLLSQWDTEKNGSLTSREVSYGSHKKIWWQCGHGHQWQAAVYTRTGTGSGCPYCKEKNSHPEKTHWQQNFRSS